MYETFFGLRERPFELTPNPRFVVLTDGHREALANLRYAIGSRKGITLLLGDAGSGKTTLVHTAIAEQPQHVHCVYVNNPALTRDEFVELLAEGFHLSAVARRSKAAMLIELEALLKAREADGETSVLMIDEAQSLPLPLLEEIRLLANIETADTKLVSVIITGQPEFGDRLEDASLRQLKQRIALRCELQPLSVWETAGYVAGRIKLAGGQGAQVFTRDAVTTIHERSRGIPRQINVIGDNSLVTGFALRQRPVTAAIVREVCDEFGLADPAAASDRIVPADTIEPSLLGPPAAAAPAPESASADIPALLGRFSRRGWRLFS